jgi:hypothetical protein
MPVSWLGCWAALDTRASHAESAGDRPAKGHLPERGFGHVAVLGMSQRPIHLPQERRIAPSNVHGPGVAYEVEFFDASERTLGIETLSAQQLKPTVFPPVVHTAPA